MPLRYGVTMAHERDSATPASAKRATFVLLIWPEHQDGDPPLWRGMLETALGNRRYFRSLEELKQIVSDVGGWEDGLDSPPGGHSTA